MQYFAIDKEGLIFSLGDHGDIEAAEDTAENIQANAIFIFDEDQARAVAGFILDQLGD